MMMQEGSSEVGICIAKLPSHREAATIGTKKKDGALYTLVFTLLSTIPISLSVRIRPSHGWELGSIPRLGIGLGNYLHGFDEIFNEWSQKQAVDT